jgi:hypothetical protein
MQDIRLLRVAAIVGFCFAEKLIFIPSSTQGMVEEITADRALTILSQKAERGDKEAHAIQAGNRLPERAWCREELPGSG